MTIRTWARVGSLLIMRVAARPSVPGIRMSIRTTSARSSLASRTASAPSDASPTTSMSASESTSTRKALRSSAWSSASRTRMVIRGPLRQMVWCYDNFRAGRLSSVCRSYGVGGAAAAGLDRQDRMHPEAAAVTGTGGQGAAQGGDALAHTEQAMAAAVRGVLGAGAVVEDGDLDVRSHPYDADLGLRRTARVLLDVGEGFLDDPVGGEADGCGQGGAGAGAGDLDLESGAAEGADQFVEAVAAGGGLGG